MNRAIILVGFLIAAFGVVVPFATGSHFLAGDVVPQYGATLHFVSPSGQPVSGVLTQWNAEDGSTVNCLGSPAPTNLVTTGANGEATCDVTTSTVAYEVIYSPPSPYVSGIYTYTPTNPTTFVAVYLSTGGSTTTTT